MSRLTKIQVYSKYGVKAQKFNTSLKIYCDPLEMWINPILVNGNKKIGRGCYHFSTTAGNEAITPEIALAAVPNYSKIGGEILAKICGGTCGCNCENCYAQQGCYTFRSTKISVARKTFLAHCALAWLETAIRAQLEADHIKLLRIHVAGDFFNKAYVNMWIRVITEYRDTVFWTYTKSYGLGFDNELLALNNLPNMNIVDSLPLNRVNFGTCAEIIALYNELKARGESVYICKCGVDVNQHCVGCHHCATCKYVLFLKHGDPKYNPEEDPLYPVFCKLVLSQAD